MPILGLNLILFIYLLVYLHSAFDGGKNFLRVNFLTDIENAYVYKAIIPELEMAKIFGEIRMTLCMLYCRIIKYKF